MSDETTTKSIDEMTEEEIAAFEALHGCKVKRKTLPATAPADADLEFFRLGYIDLQQRVAFLEEEYRQQVNAYDLLSERVRMLETQSQPSASTDSPSVSE